MGSGHRGFPDQTFLQLAVAADGVNLERLTGQLCADGHANGDGDALAQRAGGGVHTGALFGVRMALKDAVQLTEVLQLLPGEEALVSQHGVESRGGMALGENEAVPILPVGIGGVHVHGIVIQAGQHLHDGQGAAGMAGSRVSRHVDDVSAQLPAFAGEFFFCHSFVSLLITPKAH